jgi:hypothetical protein
VGHGHERQFQSGEAADLRAPESGAGYDDVGGERALVWGLAVNAVAVLYGAAMTVNLAWPRSAVYGNDHWYYQWGAVVFTLVIAVVGAVCYAVRREGRRSVNLTVTPAENLVSEA